MNGQYQTAINLFSEAGLKLSETHIKLLQLALGRSSTNDEAQASAIISLYHAEALINSARAAEKQARNLSRATLMLVAATLGLVLVTLMLVLK